ncbi:hypothetical protein CRYUN_Cryun02cG0112600 [Craigia yunnanensis]
MIFLQGLQDKKLKGQLAIREELYGKSAKAAAKIEIEKWLLPSEGGYLEAEGIEKTWRIKQESIAREVDILSSRNQYDIILPGARQSPIELSLVRSYDKRQLNSCELGIFVDSKVLFSGTKPFDSVLGSYIPQSCHNCGIILARETVCDVVYLHNGLFFTAD